VVSMANSGAHSNGSQIFITAAPQPGLNDKHSVFGRVVSGQSIIDNINTTPVNGSVPQTPITIQAVAVYGPSLASFDLFPATLPTIVDAQPVLTKSGATFTLNYDARTYSNYIGYRGDNLSTWTAFANSYFGGTPPTSSVNVTSFATGARYFFRLARIDYSTTAARFIPASAAGRTFTFTSNFPALIIVTFNSTGTGGTWNIPGSGTGIFSTLFFSPGRFTAAMRLLFDSAAVLGGNVDFRPTVDYTSANAGPFTGSTNLPGYPTLTGTFTTTP